MVTNIQSTELDFQAIKAKLKTYFSQSEEFADYNFEASGLSNILDVLAYNTHFNSLIANMAINESYLETAQLRSSVVTHAQSLGYYPRSKTASAATLTLSLDLSAVPSRPATVTLPSGTKFNSTIEGQTYVFQTIQTYSATDDGNGIYVFQDTSGNSQIKVYEGTYVTKTFMIPAITDKRLYVIPDPDMDTNTVIVRVYPSRDSSTYDSYSNIKDSIRITSESRYYILREAPNGYYELQFSDETAVGITPDAGNMATVTYLSVSGAEANGGQIFTAQSNVTVGASSYPLIIDVNVESYGGAERQSIDSIRYHAPLNYAAQNRMVTASDYHTLIQVKYPIVEDVIAWGGQDHTPIDYGKVYISIKYPDGTSDSVKEDTQDDIRLNLIEPLGILGITPEFVEPLITYLGLDISFDFNPTLSGLTSQSVETIITNSVKTFFTENMGQFEKEFRRSNLLSLIDDLSPAILSSSMIVTLNQYFTPILGSSNSYVISFPTELANPSSTSTVISSSRFIYNSEICQILNTEGTTTLHVVNSLDEIVLNNIGNYELGTGKVYLTNLNMSSIVGGGTDLKITAVPSNQSTIKPLKNYILDLDESNTIARARIDYQTFRTSL